MFDYLINTRVQIYGKYHVIRFENGMTGIGSRKYWVDDKEQFNKCVRQSTDLEKGNHYIYSMKWRDTPWDRVDIIISEDLIAVLLAEENKWREPRKREFKSKATSEIPTT